MAGRAEETGEDATNAARSLARWLRDYADTLAAPELAPAPNVIDTAVLLAEWYANTEATTGPALDLLDRMTSIIQADLAVRLAHAGADSVTARSESASAIADGLERVASRLRTLAGP